MHILQAFVNWGLHSAQMYCVNSTVYAYRQLKFVFCLQDMHKLVTFFS